MEKMFNNYYLLKRVQEEEGKVAYASVQDSFTYIGEVVKSPYQNVSSTFTTSMPSVGDKVLFLKGSGEDVTVDGEQMKVVKFEDIVMTV